MIKVDIISGFLGAGKTTFIKELISKVYKDEKLVLIENEFGEIGIDSHFMKGFGIEVTEMNSGCICCTLVGDFAKSLKQVADEFAPDRIIIEPSGVGKLSDVAKAVIDVQEEVQAEIDNMITVVDGSKAKMYMKNFGEFFNNQIEHAEVIVISRSQNLDESKLGECVKLIREKNEKASVITTPWDIMSEETIRSALVGKHHLKEELHALKQQIHCSHSHENDHEHGSHHHEHEHDGQCSCGCHGHEHHHGHDFHEHHHADEIFKSWGIETVHEFNKNELEDILKLMAVTDNFGKVLRAKGVVLCEDKKWMEFDMVPEELEIRECRPDYIGRICVIGTELKEENLNEVFAK